MSMKRKEFNNQHSGTRLEQVKNFLKENSDKAFTAKEIVKRIKGIGYVNVSVILNKLETDRLIERKRVGKIIYNMWRKQK